MPNLKTEKRHIQGLKVYKFVSQRALELQDQPKKGVKNAQGTEEL